MRNISDEKILRLQKNLSIIRNLAGWTAEDLGENIGVTRQTITNLEKSQKRSMTKTQYIAIRAVLDYEIAHSNNETLANAISVLVDADDLSEEQKQKVEETVTRISSTKSRRVNDRIVKEGIIALITAIGVVTLSKQVTSKSTQMTTLKWLEDVVEYEKR